MKFVVQNIEMFSFDKLKLSVASQWAFSTKCEWKKIAGCVLWGSVTELHSNSQNRRIMVCWILLQQSGSENVHSISCDVSSRMPLSRSIEYSSFPRLNGWKPNGHCQDILQFEGKCDSDHVLSNNFWKSYLAAVETDKLLILRKSRKVPMKRVKFKLHLNDKT
jgi:hypothetical protein